MYPLDAVYGPKSYQAFHDRGHSGSLKYYQQQSKDIANYEPIVASTYVDLINIISFFGVMNKRHSLFFRGQGTDLPPKPAIFRDDWRSGSYTRHIISHDPAIRERVWRYLENEISEMVLEVCNRLPMPRKATLKMFREARWAVAQHYGLWPTPLIDVTQNLRIAASFALWGGRAKGWLYVAALPPSTNSVTFDADQHVVLARLQAVCPPVAKRPHYQDGFLAGRFPFLTPTPNMIDKNPANVSDLHRRLIARIVLVDSDNEEQRTIRQPSGNGFWTSDFPRISESALLPGENEDELLRLFATYRSQIDKKMKEICDSRAPTA